MIAFTKILQPQSLIYSYFPHSSHCPALGLYLLSPWALIILGHIRRAQEDDPRPMRLPAPFLWISCLCPPPCHPQTDIKMAIASTDIPCRQDRSYESFLQKSPWGHLLKSWARIGIHAPLTPVTHKRSVTAMITSIMSGFLPSECVQRGEGISSHHHHRDPGKCSASSRHSSAGQTRWFLPFSPPQLVPSGVEASTSIIFKTYSFLVI